MNASDLDIALLDFTPVPRAERQSPGRVKSIQARMYVDQFAEHARAFDILQRQQELFGEGSKTMVRALLHFRDQVVWPLEHGSVNGNAAQLRRIAHGAFTPLETASRPDARTKTASARLLIDKYQQHREAVEFLQTQQELFGEGNKTIIRALNFYEDTVLAPLRRKRAREGAQLTIDVLAR